MNKSETNSRRKSNSPARVAAMKQFTCLILLWAISVPLVLSSSYKRVCYLTIGHRPFDNVSQHVVSDMCTHINIIAVSIDNDGNVFPTRPGDPDYYKAIQELRLLNPKLKILATLVDSGSFSEATRDDKKRKHFANSILNFTQTYNFDGIDIDWEFPVYSLHRPDDRSNFVSLLRGIRTLFDSEGKGKLLTVAVPGDYTIAAVSYDGRGLNSTVDHVNLMTYDLRHWDWFFPFTGHNAALYPYSKTYYLRQMNMAFSAAYWQSLGLDKEKIVVGIPTYSHSFLLLNRRMNWVGAPAKSAGPNYSYAEICQFIRTPGFTRVFDEVAGVPYIYNATIWISYEDVRSAGMKAQWIRDHEFGGSMTYNINNDDMDGSCSSDRQPFILHRIIRSILRD